MGGVEDVTDLCIGISSEEGRFSLLVCIFLSRNWDWIMKIRIGYIDTG